MDFTCIFLGTLFIAAGILFALGKVHVHLAAWKHMSPREKDKIDIHPLCRNIGAVIALSGMVFLLKGLWSGFENRWFSVCMIVWLLGAGLDVWYITKSRRYYNK